jgi:hypothetical protein
MNQEAVLGVEMLNKDRRAAQSASELAVFGAVLVFIIGALSSTGLASTQQMNFIFRALRVALSESYRTGEGAYGGSARQARSSASVFIIEDRLAVSASEPLGTRDRFPLTASGRGTFSKSLYYPLDVDEYDDSAAIFDLFVNGQRFPFTTTGVREIVLSDADDTQPDWAPTCVFSGSWVMTQFPSPPSPPQLEPVPGGACWEPRCINEQGVRSDPNPVCLAPPYNGDCTACEADGFSCTIDTPFNVDRGCMVMFKKEANCQKGCDDWNSGETERFDLDFDGVIDVNPADRADFGWQWVPVAGLLEGASGLVGTTSWSIILPFSPQARGMKMSNSDSGEKALNVTLDADGDWAEEQTVNISVDTETFTNTTTGYSSFIESFTADDPVIRSVLVSDPNEGDMDFAADDRTDWIRTEQGLPVQKPFNLLDDIKMYSFTLPGTLLEVREGQLFLPSTGRFVRDTSLHDHVDVIQRTVKLNRNNLRFCDASNVPVSTVSGLSNPVEACGNCFGEAGDAGDNDAVANVEQTCFDGDILTLFIRSRVQDLRGRRWVTRFDA